jgi:hypothetical protein
MTAFMAPSFHVFSPWIPNKSQFAQEGIFNRRTFVSAYPALFDNGNVSSP